MIGRCNRVVSDVGGDSPTTQAPRTTPLTYHRRRRRLRRRRRRRRRERRRPVVPPRVFSSDRTTATNETAENPSVREAFTLVSFSFRRFARHAASRCLFAGRRTDSKGGSTRESNSV